MNVTAALWSTSLQVNERTIMLINDTLTVIQDKGASVDI
jgi:hypothetical protein